MKMLIEAITCHNMCSLTFMCVSLLVSDCSSQTVFSCSPPWDAESKWWKNEHF